MTQPQHRSSAAQKRLMPNAVAGALQALVSGLLLFVLYRVLLAHVGASQVGAWSLLMAWLTLARLLDLGLPGGMVRLAAAALASGEVHASIKMLQRGILIVSALTAAGAALIALLVHRYAPSLLAVYEHPVHVLAGAAGAAWLTCVAAAARAALDALGRVDLRHGTTILQNVCFLAGSAGIVAHEGVRGLVLVQCSSLLVAICLAGLLFAREARRHLAAAGGNAAKAKPDMGALVRYAVPFQVSTIAAMLVDPLVKLMLGQFAGLADVGWYEMASRLVLQVRNIIVNALEALVPHVAALGRDDGRKSLAHDYRRIFDINLCVSSLALGLVVANLPLVQRLWLGSHQPVFALTTAVLAASWWVNGLAAPAYFVGLGLGVQRWNVASHLIMTVGVAVLGLALGMAAGGKGVLLSFFAATCISTVVLLRGLHREIAAVTGEPVRTPRPLGYGLAIVLAALAPTAVSAHASLVTLLGHATLASLLLVVTVAYTGENRQLALAALAALKRRRAASRGAPGASPEGHSIHS